MGIFKRRKADEAFKIQLEREALDQMNRTEEDDGYVLPLELQGEDSVWNMHGIAKAPHTITADELNGRLEKKPTPPKQEPAGSVETIAMESTRPTESGSDFLFKRMTESRAQAAEQVVQTPAPAPVAEPPKQPAVTPVVTKPNVEQPAPPAPTVTPAEPKQDIDALIRSLHEELNHTKSHLSGHSVTDQKQESVQKTTVPDPVVSAEPEQPRPQPKPDPKPQVEAQPQQEATEVEKIPVTPATPPVVDPATAKRVEERRTTLLARCNAYLKDDEFGTAKIDTEKYKLESVESILQSFEARATQRVKKNLDLKAEQNTAQIPTPVPQAPVVGSSPVTPTKPSVKPAADLSQTTAFVMGADGPKATPKDEPTEAKPEKAEAPAPVKHYFTTPIPPKAPESDAADLSETKILTDLHSSSQAAEKSADATAVFQSVTPTEPSKPKAEPKPQPQPAQEAAFPNDYRSVSDRDRILKDLAHSRSKLTTKVWLDLLLLILSILLLTPLAASWLTVGSTIYYVAEIALAVLAIAIHFSSFKSVASLFSAKADPELPAALAAIAVLLQSIIRFVAQQPITGFSAALLLSFAFGTMAKRGFYTRTMKNFDLIANSSDKQAVAIVKSQEATKEIVGNSIEGSALICCGVKTTNLKNFLRYTYSADPSAAKIKPIALIGLAVGVILGIVAGVMTGNIATGSSVFAAALCVVAVPGTLWISNLPLHMAAGRLRIYGAMLTGHRAADEFDLCNGIAVSCNDLFPEGTIRLVDMKLLSPNPIDQSMLDAAALAEAIGSPLAGIFKQVSTASSYHNHTPKVDTIAYEEKMGISGWVNDRRVFVGNRILMEAHGFSNLPPVELDKKIMRKGYFPVYLVSDNVPCALLVVKYTPDEEIAYELRRLCNTGTTVLVHNCDPNISDQMLCDYFGLYPETVAVMSKRGSDQYQELTKYRREINAGAACRGPVSGLFATMTAGIQVKRAVSAMTALYVVMAILGLLAIGVSVFTPLLSHLNTVAVLIYQLISTLLICLPPLLKRP